MAEKELSEFMEHYPTEILKFTVPKKVTMAEKEERILVARSTDYTITDTDKGELFEGKIAPHCANVFTRQEAIERMAKAISKAFLDDKGNPQGATDKELAEAALNALLGEK